MKRDRILATLVALPWAGWAVVRLFGLENGHPLVPAIAFTPYVAASAWVPVLVALLLRRRDVAVGALAVAVALVAVVVPRALPGPRPSVPDGARLAVMTANLAYGRADPAVVLALARSNEVDVLSLQELTPESARRLDAAGARDRFPYQVLDARPAAGGSGLMSRIPLADPARPRTTRLAMPEGTLRVGGSAMAVKAVHAVPPLGGDVAVWERELGSLPSATPGGPLRMLIGDFNATNDHRRFRDLLDSGYTDAADAAGQGLGGTYRDGRLLPPPVAIDHVLVDRRIRVETVSVHSIRGSDHRAVVAVLTVPRGR